MVRPALRRDVVGVLRGTYGISKRLACALEFHRRSRR
jgi:hypothetical protein